MIYEYRVYDIMPGKMFDFQARIRHHTFEILERHGITNIGYWTPALGDFLVEPPTDQAEGPDRLAWLVAYENAEQRDLAWKAVGADPERKRIFSETEVDGPLKAGFRNSLLIPTDFSPLQ